MAVIRKHYVIFMSPGTFVTEVSERQIEDWNPAQAAAMAAGIVERYGAIPYGFHFETRLSAPPVTDGEGGFLEVTERTVATSGTYFWGRLETYDDVAARSLPDERILVDNMRDNDWWIVVVDHRRWKSTQPFTEESFLIDGKGRVIERGDDPKHVAYRAAKHAQREAERLKGPR